MDEDLVDHLNKCRFCLDKIKSTRLAVRITEEIQQSYFSLTNSKLKTSKNYSSVICKTCLKKLSSSVDFQQKIMSNQERLQNFDFKVPVKEESAQEELFEAVEIKTECFEFAPIVVESIEEASQKKHLQTENDDRIDEDVPSHHNSDEEVDAESDVDYKPRSRKKRKRKLKVDVKKDVVTPQVPAVKSLTICPYCAETFNANSMAGHIEAHENKINNTPLICEKCDYSCFNNLTMKAHCRTLHPELLPETRELNAGSVQYSSRFERREALIEFVKKHPKMNSKKIATKFNITTKSVQKIMRQYDETGTVERKKRPGRPKLPDELDIEIGNSFHSDPLLSLRQRARTFNTSKAKVQRIARTIGFKLEIDDSHRIHKCTICPSKYSARANLVSHIRRKHGTTE